MSRTAASPLQCTDVLDARRADRRAATSGLKRVEAVGQIGDDADVDADVLADLRRVDIDVNLARAGA